MLKTIYAAALGVGTLLLLTAYFGERDRRFRERDRFGAGAGLRRFDCRDGVGLRG